VDRREFSMRDAKLMYVFVLLALIIFFSFTWQFRENISYSLTGSFIYLRRAIHTKLNAIYVYIASNIQYK